MSLQLTKILVASEMFYLGRSIKTVKLECQRTSYTITIINYYPSGPNYKYTLIVLEKLMIQN